MSRNTNWHMALFALAALPCWVIFSVIYYHLATYIAPIILFICLYYFSDILHKFDLNIDKNIRLIFALSGFFLGLIFVLLNNEFSLSDENENNLAGLLFVLCFLIADGCYLYKRKSV